MNVAIRPLEEKDAYTSVKWRNMPEIWQYTAYKWTREITIEDELAWIRKVSSDPTGSRFAILADGVYVGNVYLTSIKDGVGEYSIFIGEKEYWGKGIARKASAQIIDYGKKVLKLHTIILGVNPGNKAAVNIYKDLGFVDTGEKMQNVFTLMKLNLADWDGDPRDKMKKMKPKVSILCITFNQGKFIRQTLDGFLSQKTNFAFEVLIHDDASTDGTTDIVREYAAAHPDIIKPIFEKKNQYSQANLTFITDMYHIAKGEYIATCEGDDYWTDPHKLQKQIDFLDQNPDYAICFHSTEVVYEGIDKKSYLYPDVADKSWYTLEQLFTLNYMSTCSAVYRKQNYKNFRSDIMPGDWYTHLYHAQFGKIKFINEPMAVYRKHVGGVFWEYDEDRDKIWLKHGINYVKFYGELLHIYKKQEHFVEIINEQLFEHLDKLTGVDEKYDTHMVTEAFSLLPEKLTPFLTRQHNKITELQTEVDDLKNEMLAVGDQRHDFEVEADALRREIDGLHARYKKDSEQLERIKNTKVWKAAAKVAHVKNKLKGGR